jgi:hypothetical protein
MFKGLVRGTGTRMFTTPAGKHHIRENGLELLVLDPTASPLHRRGDNMQHTGQQIARMTPLQ